ncbi:MAG: zinc-binding dehydrogenase [Chloroflexi bacterium]|nr:zinc-binding dehydrogenase [Chloroflexota bacterium]
MKAARLTSPKHFEFVEAETPTPQDGQCLIKLERVSVCGSDIRNYYGPVLPEDNYPLGIGKPCHEVAGTIVESRTDAFREGQRAIAILTSDIGGLAEYVVSGPERMALLPDTGPLDEWVMCQPSGTVLYSCQQMPNLLGKTVLVLGQGSIGLSFTMITSRMGARSVIGADLLDYRLEKSRELGATHTINPSREEISEAVEEITGGVGPDVVVEAAGYPDTFNMCFRLVRQFGTIIIFGVQTDDWVPIEHHWLLDKQPRIIPTTGARSGDPISHIREIVALRERGWCDPGKLVTHRIGFSQVQTAYDMYEQRLDNVIKVVMNINE